MKNSTNPGESLVPIRLLGGVRAGTLCSRRGRDDCRDVAGDADGEDVEKTEDTVLRTETNNISSKSSNHSEKRGSSTNSGESLVPIRLIEGVRVVCLSSSTAFLFLGVLGGTPEMCPRADTSCRSIGRPSGLGRAATLCNRENRPPAPLSPESLSSSVVTIPIMTMSF